MNDCENKDQKTSVLKEVISWVLTIGIPVAVVLLLNAFVGKLVIVQGSSMYPTLYDGDLLVVRSIAYTPENGDVIVCKTADDSALGGEYIVKRIIGTDGQTVEVNYEDNTVTVDGIILNEDYLNYESGDPLMDNAYCSETYVVPEGCVFVMGDNRNNSTDSRSNAVGMVPLDTIVGEKILRLPIGEWKAGE